MRQRLKLWPGIVVCLLGANVVGTLYATHLAGNDPHAAVEPDYYQKAVGWDSTMAQERRNEVLGWQVTPSLGAIGTARTSTIGLSVLDGAGRPVTGASVHVDAVAVMQADSVVRATLDDLGSGAYGAPLAIRRTGLWEVHVSVVRGAERYTRTLRLDVSASEPAHEVAARPGDATAERTRAGMRTELKAPGA